MKTQVVAALITLVGLSAPALAAEIVFGTDSSYDGLYTIDLANGAITDIGPLNPDISSYTTPVAMAVRPSDGAIFVINNTPEGVAGLSTVDPNTGLATFVGLGAGGGQVLSFGPGERLFGAPGSQLIEYDPATGAVLGVIGGILPRLLGLDYNLADGHLYGLTSLQNVGLQVLEIDPITGNTLNATVLSAGFALGNIATSLLFDSAGALHGASFGGGASPQLYEIDLNTGIATNQRPTRHIAQGLGLMTAHVPIPAAAWLFGSALLGLGAAKRRKA